ncbi:MAG: hypothetical protein LBV63_03265 [Candidatus Methanoplasma sp.]|jgi:SpoU rRNA methylase family enzyme|nr:hypothetical protein [Candidatus Methanoplasma sp.]
MRKSPQDIVRAISYALKEGKKGDGFEIVALARSTEMHYVTVYNYLGLIEYIQNNIPKVSKIDQKENAKVTILQELDMSISSLERMLLDVFDKGAFMDSSSISVEHLDSTALSEALDRQLIVLNGSQCHLSRKGLMDAMDLAEEREDKVLFSDTPSTVVSQDDIRVECWKCPHMKQGIMSFGPEEMKFREVHMTGTNVEQTTGWVNAQSQIGETYPTAT